MASTFKPYCGYESYRFFIETKDGFLTTTGVSKDINDKDIISLSYADADSMIREDVLKKILELSSAGSHYNTTDCTLRVYSCPLSNQYSCKDCKRLTWCNFINNRKKCFIL